MSILPDREVLNQNQDDESFLHAALRETQEELGIEPSRIEVLGPIGSPEFNLSGDMLVWPFVVSVSTTAKLSISNEWQL